ncbi:MAG: TVP38/TMEM64 family protein [Pirellulales bacterium]|nr:TVP38/TMEM64 family protein [Pirellulales bacterium]
MSKSNLLRVVAALLIPATMIAGALIFSRAAVREAVVALLVQARELGPGGAVVAALLYVPACVLALPGSLLTLTIGFAFGPVLGALAASLGSTAGATVAFYLGRTIGRDWIRKKVGGSPRFLALDDAVATQGFRIVLLTRLSPVFPFNVQNYAYGLTKVRPRDYVLASWIGMFPGTLLYVYLGSAIGSVADLVAGRFEQTRWQQIAFLMGLAATLAVALLLARLARRALRDVERR